MTQEIRGHGAYIKSAGQSIDMALGRFGREGLALSGLSEAEQFKKIAAHRNEITKSATYALTATEQVIGLEAWRQTLPAGPLIHARRAGDTLLGALAMIEPAKVIGLPASDQIDVLAEYADRVGELADNLLAACMTEQMGISVVAAMERIERRVRA